MPPTVQTLLDAAVTRLAPLADSARLDAELLLAHALARPREHLRAWPELTVPDTTLAVFEQLVAARSAGQPLAYLTGMREFWSLPLKLTRDTLVPRPETEMLVQVALARIPADVSWRLADLGTGSGAIALALASERLLCRVTATDASVRALNVARENAARLGLGNVEFRCGDWYAALPPTRYHLIASNPPYVRAADPHLRQGDLRFEPWRALASGADGMQALRRIIAGAPAWLVGGGWLLLEHGYDQAEAVRALLAAQGFSEISSQRDLSGHERVTFGQLPY